MGLLQWSILSLCVCQHQLVDASDPEPILSKLVGALLCRNEAGADRYLKLVLDNALTFCDTVVALDDGSTDATRDVLGATPGVLMAPEATSSDPNGFWGHDEATPRARLWDAAVRAAGPDGWVYVLDADHELVGVTPRDLRTCLTSDTVTAWALPLWDCWTEDGQQMRVDGYWQAHLHPRPWFFKAQLPGWVPDWSTINRKGVHTGHCPPNFPLVTGVLPGAAIRHWGYTKQAHREAKADRYLALV